MSAHVMFLGVQRTGFIQDDQNEIDRDQRGAVKDRAAISNLGHHVEKAERSTTHPPRVGSIVAIRQDNSINRNKY